MRRRISEQLGAQIRTARRLAGLTQRELGAAVGEQHQTIQKIECGILRIKADQIWRIAKALGRPVEWFFAGLDDDSAGQPAPRVSPPRPRAQAAPPAPGPDLRRVNQRS